MITPPQCRNSLLISLFLLFSYFSNAQTGPANLSPQQAAELLQADRNVVVIDVRTPGEYRSGHLKNAINVDYTAPDFEQKLTKLDRNATYLVHCAVGGRSTKSLPVLEKLGFRNIRHLDGGIQAWQRVGLPVVK